jgi:spore maturation protein CgeB
MSKYADDGFKNVILSQWACDADSLLEPLSAEKCSRQTSFVGTATPKRKTYIKELAKRGIIVECFGQGWSNGPVDTISVKQIIRESIISLNFSSNNNFLGNRQRQLKARTFEVPGAGGFLLTEDADDLDRYFTPNVDVATFRSIDELQSQIHYFTQHPSARDTIAQSGHRRAAQEHTYEQRLTRVLDFACAKRTTSNDCTSTTNAKSINWAQFHEAERQYLSNMPLLKALSTLELLCSVCWGPKRGRRALRRMLFEACWRLNGAATYCASGLPGRIFYDVS